MGLLGCGSGGIVVVQLVALPAIPASDRQMERAFAATTKSTGRIANGHN